MEADYTKQLMEIVQALNRPTFPPWAAAALSAGLGFFGGTSTQLFMAWFNVRRQRYYLRKVLYADLGEKFLSLHRVVFPKLHENPNGIGAFGFQAREHARKTPDLYLSLTEYHRVEDAYEDLANLSGSRSDKINDAILFVDKFAEEVEAGGFEKAFFSKALGTKRGDFASAIAHVSARNKEFESGN